MKSTLTALVVALSFTQGPSGLKPDAAIACQDCDAWNVPHEPVRVFGNTYDVGVTGLGTILITSDKGHILLDAGLPQSAPLIDANIRKLGFRTGDIRLIVNSHAHYDHAGGIAAMQRASGAEVAASAAGAKALRQGLPTADDPQIGFGADKNRFPAVANVRAVSDGEVLRVGDLALTAHLTPGHTPGSTTWTWRSCEGAQCKAMVYADSLNAIAAPGFRFTGDKTHPSIVDAFRRSISTVGELPCDVLLTVHPPVPEGRTCRTYAGDAAKRLDARIAQERAPVKKR